jgi:hypothetical protein
MQKLPYKELAVVIPLLLFAAAIVFVAHKIGWNVTSRALRKKSQLMPVDHGPLHWQSHLRFSGSSQVRYLDFPTLAPRVANDARVPQLDTGLHERPLHPEQDP